MSRAESDPARLREGPSSPARFSLGVTSAVLALACGLTVANLYYAQPLLHLIANDFGVGQGAATVVVTLTQLGYALGLALVLPLGDMLENRALASRTLLGTAVALLVAGLSTGSGCSWPCPCWWA